MTYHNLPSDWPDLPVTGDEYAADLLDLFVNPRERRNGALFVLLCDDQRRPLQPIIIDDAEGESHRPPDCLDLLGNLAAEIAQMVPRATALVAVARDGSLSPSVLDRAWHRCVTRAFAGHVELIGIHLITLRGCIPLLDSDAA